MDAVDLRAQLKRWERDFRLANQRAPSRADIDAQPAIGKFVLLESDWRIQNAHN